MDTSEFLIQRTSEAIQRLSPINRLNFVIPTGLAIVVLVYVFPNLNDSIKNPIAAFMLLGLVAVTYVLPRRFTKSIRALLSIQTNIFLSREKVDHLSNKQVEELMGVLEKIEVSRNRNGLNVEQLEKKALELIRQEA